MTEDIDLIRVTGVEYVKDYTMRLEFSTKKLRKECNLLEMSIG